MRVEEELETGTDKSFLSRGFIIAAKQEMEVTENGDEK